jgi:predicted DNA-binding transcriptional regulator AlpA
MNPKSSERSESTSKELWTAEQVARFLGVPVSTLYRWRCFGEGPPAYRVGRHLRYDPLKLQLWLDERAA